MEISLTWLKRYVDLSDLSVDEISEILTTIGLEVEGYHQVDSVKGGLKGIVVGKVLTCEKHPDADKLSITTVDLGDITSQIVCGAPNVATGQKVLVATLGATLYPMEGESFKIKKSKIRGVDSEGMICAADELSLGHDHSGIMVLDENAQVGIPAAEYLNLESDIVFEIGLTPNRSDALCHLGVAQDLVAYLKVNKDKKYAWTEPQIDEFKIAEHSLPFDVKVLDSEDCPRYSGLTISGITIGPSPDWLKKLLNSIGVKSINNVVDVTNFILHEYGQPLHAFDADKIPNKKIVVQKLPKDTLFKALDEREFKLNGLDLIICDDQDNGMCIAGVFGGLDTGVSNTTTSIFLESAHFRAKAIRNTSMRLNLRTDAAKVFEKGSDPSITVKALKRAALLITELAGGKISSDIVDIYPIEILPAEINVKYDKIKNLLGIDLSIDKIHEILISLNMTIASSDENSITVKVPTNKADVTRDIDVVEEILRIYGFNSIPIPTSIYSTISYSPRLDKNKIKNRISNHLTSIGFNEIMGLSLIDSKICTDLLGLSMEQMVEINNTSNSNLDVMRPDLILSGLLSVLHNHNRQQTDIKLYEFGKQYRTQDNDFVEEEGLTIFISGNTNEENWQSGKSQSSDYYSIKAAIAEVFNHIGLDSFQIKDVEDQKFSYGLEYYRGNQSLAKFGELHPKIIKRLGLKTKVFAAHIIFANILNAISKNNLFVKQISKFPSVRRDLAIVFEDSVSFLDIESLALKTEKKLLKEVSLIDVYRNDQMVSQGQKSYAMSFLFEPLDKTLSDQEIDLVMQNLIEKFEKNLGGKIRK